MTGFSKLTTLTILTTASLALVGCAGGAQSAGDTANTGPTSKVVDTTNTTAPNAEDKKRVQAFYDYLSNPGSESHAQAFRAVASENWESIGDYSGKTKSRDAFVGQMGGFAKLIPDLKWAVQSMLQDGNRVIVRSRATGTPSGPLFGVDGQGRGFDIMTIDIHELDNGVITRTYHLEDWAGALRQLKGPPPS